jgi:hypothetical protein
MTPAVENGKLFMVVGTLEDLPLSVFTNHIERIRI